MLKELSIENLAVIEKASITFGDKLNVFTGETGAGKSILIGGINAILGGRVTKDIVRFGAQKAVITGLFDDLPDSVLQKLSDYGFSCEDEVMLQREITAEGKSTARINGRATTVLVLREIACELIGIHGQHDNRLIMSNDYQREILDEYAKNSELLNEYQTAFKEFSSLSRKIKELNQKNENDTEKAELLRERIEELDSLNFSQNEEELINQKLDELRNAEFLSDRLYTAFNAMTGDDETKGACSLVSDTINSLNPLCELKPELGGIVDRLSDLLGEIEDLRSEIAIRLPDDSADTASEILRCEERLSDVLRLKRKYRADLPEILKRAEQWRAELYELDNADDISETLAEQKHFAAEKVKQLAAQLTESRKNAAKQLVESISRELAFLDMPDIRITFDIQAGKVTLSGMDDVEILLSVNKGEELKPLGKIASGGELSRIMLAVKNVLADADRVNTMIFDEIDTGISGRAAAKVGIKLHETARKRQILCVTHLAQIAAAADTQLLIKKTSDESRTYTAVTTLDFEGRKREIARIISGDENDEISLKNAEMLLKRETAVI